MNHRVHQKLKCAFPNFSFVSSQLNVVDNLKYMWHLMSAKSDDDEDIMHPMHAHMFESFCVHLLMFYDLFCCEL